MNVNQILLGFEVFFPKAQGEQSQCLNKNTPGQYESMAQVRSKKEGSFTAYK